MLYEIRLAIAVSAPYHQTIKAHLKMKMKDKYPEGYFEHWLAMLSTMNAQYTKEGFEIQINHYLAFEGEDEMRNLQYEVELIVESGDLIFFIKTGKQLNIEKVNEQDLEIMTSVIRNWNS